MTKKAGERLKIGTAKAEIISYILEKKERVSEPEIRKHLLEKLDIKSQGTIYNHLKELSALECIENVNGPRLSVNYWDITKLDKLKNIRREFPNIRINSFEKSILIIFKDREYDIKKIENLSFYIKLLLSVSLFNAFLDDDINELIHKSEKIYFRDEGDIKTENYGYLLEKFVKAYKVANPNFKMPTELNIFERHMSKEVFLDLFKEFEHKTDDMIKELEKAYEIFHDLDDDLNYKPYIILLNHFINHDIFKGLDSQDENIFFENLKECQTKAENIWRKEGYLEIKRWSELRHLEELKVYSEIIQKYKQPSDFYIPDNSHEIYEMLKDFYKEQI